MAILALPFGAIISIIFTIFPAYALNLGIPPIVIGLLVVVLGSGRAVGSLMVKWAATRGERVAIVLSSLMMICSFFLLAFSENIVLIAFSLFGSGIGVGIFYPILINRVAKMSPSNRTGINVGALEVVLSTGLVLGSMISGSLAEYVWAASPFILGAVFGFALLFSGMGISILEDNN